MDATKGAGHLGIIVGIYGPPDCLHVRLLGQEAIVVPSHVKV